MTMNNAKTMPLWLVLTSYLIGFLWVCCFLVGFWVPSFDQRCNHLYPLIFALAFFSWAGLILRERTGRREHFFWLTCALLVALALGLKRGRAVASWSYIALHGFAAYWVLCRSGLLTEGETGNFLPLDLLSAGVTLPFGGFFLRISDLFTRLDHAVANRKHAPGSRKNALITLLVILAALPILVLAANLLGQADEAFRALLDSLSRFLTFTWDTPRWIEEAFGRFLLGLPVGAYLFGLVGSCCRREKSTFDAGIIRAGISHLHIAPTAAFAAVLASFCTLYLLFFAIQARHLLGAFFGTVPGTLTAAQYARSGFFQLCLVMVINFGLLAAAAVTSLVPIREQKALRRWADVLLMESILLAVTAASKLILYIHRFGFTPLRLLSMWGVLVLAAGCILSLRSLRGKPHAMKHWALFSAASFTLLCFY